jgi:hypothetical protein
MVRRIEELTGDFDKAATRWASTVRYAATTAERLPGGSSQAAIADVIADIAAMAREDRAQRCSIVVDVTACGAPFLHLLRSRSVRAAPVMAADAAGPRADKRMWHVPMREMLSMMLDLMAAKRVEVGDLEHAQTLVAQLEAYRTKTPPRDALADWRPVAHVDLACAMMLGLWWGERMLRSIVHQPPMPKLPIEIRPPTFDEAVKMLRRTN